MKKLFLPIIASLVFLVSCGGNSSVDIINPDAEFQYFYGATCPHCQELNKLVQDEDLFSKVAVEKKEVYFNNLNRDDFLALTKELGLSENETGVPFVYDKVSGKHAVGTGPALELFKSRLSGEVPSETQTLGEAENLNTEVPETLSGSEVRTTNEDTTSSGVQQNISQDIPVPLETSSN